MQEYIKEKFNELTSSECFKSKLQNKYLEDNKSDLERFLSAWKDVKYKEITSTDDIMELRDTVERSLNYFEETYKKYKLHDDDFYDLYKNMYSLRRGMDKLERCYEYPNCHFGFTKDEIDKLCSDFISFDNRIKNNWTRMSIQDR